MSKISRFYINFGNVDGIFYVGQVLQGFLNLEIDKPIKLQSIRVYVKGKAFVHWTEQKLRGPGEPRFRDVRHFSANEEYFDFTCTLLGHNDNVSQKLTLPPGKYCYPFQFQLPQHLPSSFEGQYGYVRYTIKGAIEKPWKFSHVTKTAFTVIGVLDLNTFPQIDRPISESVHKHLGCLCCVSGPISAFLSIPRRGYVPGETITINADIENMSRRKISSTSVALKMITIFHSQQKSRAVTTQIAKIQRGPIPKGRAGAWNEERLPLPALPPSFLFGCNIIDVQYKLELRLDPVGPAFEIYLPLEIIIGTVPLHSTTRQQPRSPRHDHHLRGAAYSSSSASSDPHCLVSLTFMESLFGKVNIRDDDDPEYTRGTLQYSPVYPYYIWNR